jgi:predicted nucleotidyltransferase
MTIDDTPRWLRDVLADLRHALESIYADRLRGLVLFGSWARGEGGRDSDVDVAVVLAGSVSPGAEIDRMIDVATDLQVQHDVLLSVYPVSEADYRTVQSPLLMNLRREGVAA